MQQKWMLFWVVCVCWVGCLRSASAERFAVQVVGSSSFPKKQMRLSILRKLAIEDGFHRALWRVVNRFLPIPPKSQSKPHIERLIQRQAAHFIYGFRILDESYSKHFYQVTLQVHVEHTFFLAFVRRLLSTHRPAHYVP